MRKLIWIIVVILIAVGAYFFWQKSNTPIVVVNDGNIATSTDTSSIKTFISANKDISFKYPAILSVLQKNNIITLHHQVNYSNHDACDFRGDKPISPTLTDFNVAIQEINKSLVDTILQIDPTIATSSFSGEDVIVSPGFIDRFSAGNYPGYNITEGVEGCGMITYYLPISTSKTLVIRKDMIGALSDVIDPTVRDKTLAVPGIISPGQSDAIFSSILQSLQVR